MHFYEHPQGARVQLSGSGVNVSTTECQQIGDQPTGPARRCDVNLGHLSMTMRFEYWGRVVIRVWRGATSIYGEGRRGNGGRAR